MVETAQRKSQVIKLLKDTHGITVENGKLGVWLSEEKENLENIERIDNPVEALIFKQAIALGWDCPRAQILVMYREIKSKVFEVQTVGRILRMPEAKHYDLTFPLCCFDEVSCFFPKRTT